MVLSCGLSLDGGDDDDRLVPNLITLAHLGSKQAPRVAMAVLGEEDLPAAGQGETAHSTCPASAVTKADAVSIIRRACLTLSLSVLCVGGRQPQWCWRWRASAATSPTAHGPGTCEANGAAGEHAPRGRHSTGLS